MLLLSDIANCFLYPSTMIVNISNSEELFVEIMRKLHTIDVLGKNHEILLRGFLFGISKSLWIDSDLLSNWKGFIVILKVIKINRTN